MIEQIATPVDLKLRLIPVLEHMHLDIATASKVPVHVIQPFDKEK